MSETQSDTQALPANQVVDGVLALKTDLTIYFALELKGVLLAAVRSTPVLILDLSALNEIDSSGIQLLVLMKREAVRLGHQVRLQGATEPVAQLIAFYALTAYFEDPAQEMPGLGSGEVQHG